jgi:hypothetical protein
MHHAFVSIDSHMLFGSELGGDSPRKVAELRMFCSVLVSSILYINTMYLIELELKLLYDDIIMCLRMFDDRVCICI